ncbi:MAG TPA: adenylate/guanylate cyclase domain-containing protein [Devosia sp.]|nr:adenylate/guanylate cyclase domain-containing protein [Devosia sp.]
MNRRLLPTLIGLLLVVALVALRAADPYPIQVLRDIAFDTFQRIQPRTGPEGPVRIVDIDEKSLAAIGQWPWPRDKIALLNDRLMQLGAAAIAYDVLFPEPDRLSPRRLGESVPGIDSSTLADNDEIFAAALSRSNAMLGFASSAAAPPLQGGPKGGFAVSGTDPTPSLSVLHGAVAPLKILRDAAPGLGSLSLSDEDTASAVRRVPLLWTDGTLFYPGLSVEALRLALGLGAVVILGDTTGAGTMEGLRLGDFTVPTTDKGEFWVYYREPDPNLYVSAASILGDDWQGMTDKIAGQIILIGTSASGLLDIHRTALGENVPGVSIHAQVIDQIVSGQFLARADWLAGLEILLFVVAGALLVLVVLRLGPVAGLLVAIFLIGSMGATSWILFTRYGMLVDPVFPVLGALLVYGTMVYAQFSIAERNRREVRRAFGYYVAPELLSVIERNAGHLELGGELKELTVMFSDMRGFTSFTEKHTPHETVATLNTLFGALGKQIMDRFGTIDKFIGDAIMAFWNAPVAVPNHAQKAALSAIAMREKLEQLNAEKAFGDYRLAIGIGLATGDALVGNMGLETRFDYSIIGDPVNVASRVESECKAVGFDIVAAETTALATPELAWLEAGSVQLKGKAARLKVYILVGDDKFAMTPAFIALRDAHRAMLEALRRGEGAEAMALCRTLCAPVDARLMHFYELIPGRIDDFVSAA